jgi:ribosomal protein L7/L12
MSKYHRDAIEVLAAPIDRDALVRQIAKYNPSVLVKAARTLGWSDSSLEARVRKILRDYANSTGISGKIEAIKLVRAERNLGLKEAKDFVEALQ